MGSDGAQDAEAATRTLAFGPLTGAERRRLGRLGGALYLAGTAFSFPASLALDPLPAATSQLLPAAGMLVALGALLAPWERMSALWLHALCGCTRCWWARRFRSRCRWRSSATRSPSTTS